MNPLSIVEVNSLSKTYKGSLIPAVDNLSFDIFENEIFGLLGPNGAGKTTTISMLSSLLKPSEGSIKVVNKDINENLTEIKSMIGVVSQEIALYDKLSAFENLYYFGTLYGISNSKLKKKINSSLKKLGLYKSKDVLIGKYSGGMKRRINLLAGILHEPKLLLLDEPTVGVDVQTRNVIREYLLELRDNKTTIIYSSHLMEEIQTICNRVVIIDHGKMVDQGKPHDLIASHDNCNSLEDVFLKLTGKNLRD